MNKPNLRPLILASSSARRKTLLKDLGLKFKVVIPNVNEYINPNKSIPQQLKAISLAKAKSTVMMFKSGIVIGADTIVIHKKNIFGKPRDIGHAKSMLRKLSNTKHMVYTGVSVIDIDKKKKISFVDKTTIWANKLDNKIIDRLARKGLGKAGGYGIQLVGDIFVRKMRGSFSNVVGLPIEKLANTLKRLGIKTTHRQK